MQTYIALLRGINVGGSKVIKMDALRRVFEELGFSNPLTYIQSGNVIFDCKPAKTDAIEKKITAGIKTKFGFDVPVVVKALAELTEASQNHPFSKRTREPALLHVTFLSAKPDSAAVRLLDPSKFLPEEFQIKDTRIYLYCPKGYGKSKLTNGFFETALKTRATTRNWNTIHELVRLASDRTTKKVST